MTSVLLCSALTASYVALGRFVVAHPLLGIDRAGRSFAGEFPRLAYVFTASCFFPVLLGFGLALIVLAIVSRAWRTRAIFSVVLMLVSWRVSDFAKDAFLRPRPHYWVLRHETSYSYSSGHAMFAVIVYGLWACLIATSDLPRAVRAFGATLLGLWACGIIWSRLALGAHYVTDLVGGVLLGLAMILFSAGVARAVFRADENRFRHVAAPLK